MVREVRRCDACCQVTTTLAAICSWRECTVQLAAHHGWTGYEGSKETTLTGTIKTFSYENPHASVDLDVNGKVWKVILAPPDENAVERASARHAEDRNHGRPSSAMSIRTSH